MQQFLLEGLTKRHIKEYVYSANPKGIFSGILLLIFAVNLHQFKQPDLKQTVLFVLIFFISGMGYAQTSPVYVTVKDFAKDSLSKTPIRLVPEDNYSKGLTFFCRNEWLLEKKTGVPFRFRLGSVDQVDRLEGKQRNYIKPPSLYYLPSESKNGRRNP